MKEQRSSFHLLETTIDEVHGAMRRGELSCKELAQLYIDRIAAYDQAGPALNAIQCLSPAALHEADRLDAQLARSGPAGPLHGIPILVKDQIETDDLPTTYGSALFKGFVSERNATVVDRLKAAGAIVLAKTNMGEFALGYAGSAFGTCRNPYDLARSPSGSSCGTGVGLAANFGVVGIGEDTGGSIRGPAAYNSLVGLRPTLPLVSRFGMMPASPTRDTLGPMARTVRDAAILLDVLAGYDPNDPATAASFGRVPSSYTDFLRLDGLAGVRVGVIREPLDKNAVPDADDFKEVRRLIDEALRAMAAHGTEIVDPVVIPSLLDLVRPFAEAIYETEAAMNQYLAELPGTPIKTMQQIVLSADVLPYRKARLYETVGRTTSDSGYQRELLGREQLRQAVLKTMADHRLDALVYATYDHPAPLIPDDLLTRVDRPPQPGNNRQLSPLLGYPAISVPAGFTADGLPIAIEFLGRPFSEGTLFKIAFGYEHATLHRRPPATTPALPGEP